jgi:hypothetical protein
MGSVLYKEDRLRESVEYYKNAVALAPLDRCALMTKCRICNMLHAALSLTAAAPDAVCDAFL